MLDAEGERVVRRKRDDCTECNVLVNPSPHRVLLLRDRERVVMVNAIRSRDQVERDAVGDPGANTLKKGQVRAGLQGHEIKCVVPHTLFRRTADVGARAQL
jgi:hypothetical protein